MLYNHKVAALRDDISLEILDTASRVPSHVSTVSVCLRFFVSLFLDWKDNFLYCFFSSSLFFFFFFFFLSLSSLFLTVFVSFFFYMLCLFVCLFVCFLFSPPIFFSPLLFLFLLLLLLFLFVLFVLSQFFLLLFLYLSSFCSHLFYAPPPPQKKTTTTTTTTTTTPPPPKKKKKKKSKKSHTQKLATGIDYCTVINSCSSRINDFFFLHRLILLKPSGCSPIHALFEVVPKQRHSKPKMSSSSLLVCYFHCTTACHRHKKIYIKKVGPCLWVGAVHCQCRAPLILRVPKLRGPLRWRHGRFYSFVHVWLYLTHQLGLWRKERRLPLPPWLPQIMINNGPNSTTGHSRTTPKSCSSSNS